MCISFTTSLTYSEITVAIAAPPMPRPKRNIRIGSNTAFSKLPAPKIKSSFFVIYRVGDKLAPIILLIN